MKVWILALFVALAFAGKRALRSGEHGDSENCVCISEEMGWPIDCSNQDVMEAAYTLLTEYNCQTNCDSHVCQDNFFIVQTHHDRCLDSQVPEDIEKDFHDFEDVCLDCRIARVYDPDLPDCPSVDCGDNSDAIAAYDRLVANNCESDCSSSQCSADYKTIRAFHDKCTEDAIPQNIEEGIHDLEESCEDENCNAFDADDDELASCDEDKRRAYRNKRDGDHDGNQCVCIGDEEGWVLDCSNQNVMEAAFTLIDEINCDANKCDSTPVCQNNFYIVQGHHDRCRDDQVPEDIEKDFHDYEEFCNDCRIARAYDPSLPNCPTVDCEDTETAQAAYNRLISNNCESDCSSSQCSADYKIIRAFHDLCEEDAIPQSIEEGIHDLEEPCEDENCNAHGPNDDDDLNPEKACQDAIPVLPPNESPASTLLPIVLPVAGALGLALH